MEQAGFGREAARHAFRNYLRTGRHCAPGLVETKFNPRHDPADGRFTSGPGGAAVPRGYRGMTAHGERTIRPVSGGGTDIAGRAVSEKFAPDPYALSNPLAALDHYVSGSGEPRNYYFNRVDTSHVKLADFPEIVARIGKGVPGVYPIVNAAASYRGSLYGRAQNLSPAATVGGLLLRADGVLTIGANGGYGFRGRLSADPDLYNFEKRSDRSAVGEASTTAGRQLRGKNFLTYVVGSKPFNVRGRR